MIKRAMKTIPLYRSLIRIFVKYSVFIWVSLLMIFVSSSSVFARQADRTAKYRIRVLGMNIGEFAVHQKNVGDETRIEAITDVEVKIIFTYRVKFIQNSIYRDGSLWSSHVQTIKNGKLNSDLRLEKRGEAYLLVEDGDSVFVNENITYSGSLLYFNEPVDVSCMFNERNGEKKPLKCIADQTYVITDDKDNKTNEYNYKDGILDRALLIHPLATIYLERRDP